MSRIKEARVGYSYIRKGFSYFFQHKRLWWYAIIPTAINIGILILSIYLLMHYYDNLTELIFGNNAKELIGAGFFAEVWHYILVGLIYIAKTIIFIVLLIFLLIVVFVVSLILTGPFNDALSEKVEQMISGKEIPFSLNYFVKSIWRSIIVESGKAVFFLIVPLVLLILNIIPAIGSIIYLIIASLFAAYDIGFNFFDLPMSRRLWTFKKRMKTGWRYRYHLTGFGILSLIPLFPYIFAAPMVAGGTIMYIEIVDDNSSEGIFCPKN